MAFKVEQFKAFGIPYGGARPSQFEVTMVPPPFVNGDVKKITFQCMAAQIPPAQVGSVDVPYFGRKVKVPGDRVFPDWTVNVINDEDFAVRKIMEQWSNGINTLENNLRLGDQVEDYKKNCDAFVTQYGKQGNVLRVYNIVQLWPNTVEAINLDWDRTNAIETFSVTFSYDYWTIVSTNEIQALPQGEFSD